jgi:DNA polymerase-3 subunit delta
MSPKGPLGLPEREKGGAFFLYGDDRFRKEEEARALVEWHLDPETVDFNYDPLRGTEVGIEDLASILATPPMMAEWRVVLLREVEGLASSPKARALLLDVVKKPPSGLALILTATIPRGSRAKLYQDLKRHARSVEFQEIGQNDVPGWLVEWTASRHGVRMTEEAAWALGAAVGTDLGVLSQEVAKLVSLVEEGSPIDLEAVRKGGTFVPSENRWEWFDKVGRREFPQALEGLGVLLSQGETGVGLTIGLATHLLRLGVARTGGREKVAPLLGSMPPTRRDWVARKLVDQARTWSVSELERAAVGLRRADRLLKSSSLSDGLVLEEWLLGLMAPATPEDSGFERGRRP